MKKFLSVLLVALMMFAMTACGSEDKSSNEKPSNACYGYGSCYSICC